MLKAVLVLHSCHNKVLQSGWLQRTEIYSLTKSPKPRCKNYCQNCWQSLVFLCVWLCILISASCSSFLCVCQNSPPPIRTPDLLNVGLTLSITFPSSHLQMLYFQIRSHLQVLGGHEFWGNTSQSSTNP